MLAKKEDRRLHTFSENGVATVENQFGDSSECKTWDDHMTQQSLGVQPRESKTGL